MGCIKEREKRNQLKKEDEIMKNDQDQKMYKYYRRKKYSPIAAVLKLREKRFGKKIKKLKPVKGKKVRKVKYFYNGEMIETDDSIMPDEARPLSERVDIGFQPERRQIATEAIKREAMLQTEDVGKQAKEIGNGMRHEGRRTREALGVLGRTMGQAIKTGGKLSYRGAKYGAKKAYEGAWTAANYPQVVDARVAKRLAEAEGRYNRPPPQEMPEYLPEQQGYPMEQQPREMPTEDYKPTQYEPEPSYSERPQEAGYSRRKKRKKRIKKKTIKRNVKTKRKKRTKRTKKKVRGKRKTKVHRFKKRKKIKW